MQLNKCWAILSCFLWVLLAAMPADAARKKKDRFINIFQIPLFETVPTIDGEFSEKEWSHAAGFEGLTTVTGNSTGKLEERKGKTYLGASLTHFYIAMRTEMPDGGAPLYAKIKDDIFKVVFDDSFEIWIDTDPAGVNVTQFQAMFNSLGKGIYTTHGRKGGKEIKDWNGNYNIKNKVDKDIWTVEVAIPIESISAGRKSTEGTWGFGICRNWKQPWAQTVSPGKHFRGMDTRIQFVEARSPVVKLEQLSDPYTRDIHTRLSVSNISQENISVEAKFSLDRNTMFTLNESKKLDLAAGETQHFDYKHKEDNSYAFDQTASVTSADGATTYYKRKTSWAKMREKRWDTTYVRKLPVDFKFAHYPYHKKLRLVADISGLDEQAKLERIDFFIRQQWGHKDIATFTLSQFDEHKKSRIEILLPELGDGKYEISAQAVGQGVPEAPLAKTFIRKHYEWEKNPMGRSNKVYPPFKPIQINEQTVSTVLRKHSLSKTGLPQQIVAAGRDILAQGISLTASIEGKTWPLESSSLQFTKRSEHEVKTHSKLSAGAFQASADGIWDYDGTLKYKLNLESSQGKTIDALTLTIPLQEEDATLMHAMTEGIRKGPISQKTPKGKGVVWESRELLQGELPKGFCSYIFLGSPNRGLSWFAENDYNWSWDRKTSNMELVREKGKVLIKIHLINKPTVITKPKTITFGLLAAPVKPQPEDYNWFMRKHNYRMLWTSINWGAGPGICGNLYPVGRDPQTWRMLDRASKIGALPKDEIDDYMKKTRPFFEVHGQARVDSWNRTMPNKFKGMLKDKNLFFYYNRATTSCDEEYATFLDEWLVKEMNGHDFRVQPSEQKLVPSESYIDFALHWYKKSFEFGGNHGVYWDNWYFAPSFNVEMTDAYIDADGSIIPSTGVWGLRDLVKRTFVMMNEEGMPARTFPHMTSASILPMLSFATMQLDWEWKLGSADTQDVYSREYLQIASNGRLAGTAPIPLSNHHFAKDDIRGLRSNSGVQMVHDMNFHSLIKPHNYKGQDFSAWNDRFIGRLQEFIKHPKLQTFAYWEERPQPITNSDADTPLIVHHVPGAQTWMVACGYAPDDRDVVFTVDADALGLNEGYQIINAETGESLPRDGNQFKLHVKKHEVIGLIIE